MTIIDDPSERTLCPCEHEQLTIVYKGTAKSFPQRLHKKIIDMPEEEVREKFELCRNCQAIKKSQIREIERNSCRELNEQPQVSHL